MECHTSKNRTFFKDEGSQKVWKGYKWCKKKYPGTFKLEIQLGQEFYTAILSFGTSVIVSLLAINMNKIHR